MEIEIDKIKYKVKYRHERVGDKSLNSYGGKTIASIELKGEVIRAVAVCSKHDAFNKKLGRMIATGRLTKSLQATGKSVILWR